MYAVPANKSYSSELDLKENKMKKYYKILSILISIVFIVGAFAGCGGKRVYVTFDANDGVFSDGEFFYEDEVKVGTSIDAPETPTRSGYNFAGWFDADDEKVSFPYTIKDEAEFYAEWDAIVYQVHFNTLGGESYASKPYTVDDMLELGTPSARVGYNFDGWYRNYNASTGAFSGTSVEFIDYEELPPFGENSWTFYAKWSTVSYKINYELNGGEWGDTQYVERYTIEASEALESPRKVGYMFSGWYANEELTGTAITSIPKGSTGDMDFYAKWESVAFGIAYNLNGGSWAGISYPSGYNSDTKVTLANPWRNGYTFAGWFDNAGFQDNAITVIEEGSTGDKEFWAKWEIINYNIEYILNGGTGAENRTYNITNALITLPVPTRAEFSFAGWYEQENFSGSMVTVISSGSIGHKKFYAKWNTVPTVVQTYVMEAEETNLEGPPQKVGSGASGSAYGRQMITRPRRDNASGGAAVGWLHGFGLGIDFVFESSAAVSNATVYVIVTDETSVVEEYRPGSTDTGSITKLDITVNGVLYTNWEPIIAEGADFWSDEDGILKFYAIEIPNVSIKLGSNEIGVYVGSNSNPAVGKPRGPDIDCIKISTAANLTWQRFS